MKDGQTEPNDGGVLSETRTTYGVRVSLLVWDERVAEREDIER